MKAYIDEYKISIYTNIERHIKYIDDLHNYYRYIYVKN